MAETYFISYTGEDEQCALWVAGVLEAQGRNVLIQARDMRAGSNFYSDMHDFLIKCDIFIAVLSQAYFDQGDYSGALEWYEKCYRVMLSGSGGPHPNIVSVKANMEAAYHEANPGEPFEKWHERKFSQEGALIESSEGG